jgi:hypothetical protein
VTGSVVFGDVVQVSHVGGNLTISTERPPYRVAATAGVPVPLTVQRARSQPSRLLLARHQIVAFIGRDQMLTELAAWVSDSEGMAVRLIHAAGGQGKTRLAAKVTERCAAAGWAAWQVLHTPTPVSGSKVELPGGAVLAVVDYADRWPPSALLALLTQLYQLQLSTGVVIRVLLLARSAGYWWPALADRVDADLAVPADEVALASLATDADRQGLFTAASMRFADRLDVEHRLWPPPPDLDDARFGQILAVHMTALAAVDAYRRGDIAPNQPHAVSAYLLRREYAYWHHLHARTEDRLHTPPQTMHRATYIATLTGVIPRPAARNAVLRTSLAANLPAADQIIDDHRVCYPPADPRTVLEPLHPDRLGEDFIALSTPGHGYQDTAALTDDWTLPALLNGGADMPVWAPTTITVLIETARRWPHIASDVLYPLIRQRPELAMSAGGAALTRLAGIPDIDPTVLEPVEALLPTDRHIDLDIAAAAISTILTRHRLANTNEPAEQAVLHANHAWRLTNAGQHEAALAPAEEATSIYRRLAETNPAAFLPDLAGLLSDLGMFLSRLGRRGDALAPAEEAVTIRRQLAQADPATYLPNLATSLNNLSNRLSELGRRGDALAPAEEAVTIRRQLAQADPATYLPRLATSLTNLGNRLSELGRRGDALAPAEEAVTIRRGLVQANPAAYLPDLAMSLNNVAAVLSGLGRRDDAVARVEEAVTIRRGLVQANPAAYLPDLAMSLNNLAAFLSRLGRGGALAPAEEATRIYRRLAETNPAAYLPRLAGSLTNLGNQLSELGRRDALAPAKEAVAIHRQVAQANPAAYEPDLAISLWAYARACVKVEADMLGALAAVEESIDLAMRLPPLLAGQLLGAYWTSADVLDRLGRTGEAAELRRQLDQATGSTAPR